MTACNFCNLKDETVLATEYFSVILDRAPVTKGHALLILKRHEPEVFGVTNAEWADLKAALDKTKLYLDKEYYPDGYNVGVNVGEVAGQTVPHLHVHVIPRYKNDVENPRGGVRNLMKPISELWQE